MTITLPAIGQIEGEIAWAKGDRFGIAFAVEIDPTRAKRKITREGANAGILPPESDHRRPGLYSTSSGK